MNFEMFTFPLHRLASIANEEWGQGRETNHSVPGMSCPQSSQQSVS